MEFDERVFVRANQFVALMSREGLTRETAQAALDRQERSLDELRNRTGLLIGAASLAVSFLGANAFGDSAGKQTTVMWILGATALLTFVGIVCSAVSVLIPRKYGFTFGLSGKATYEAFYRIRADEKEIDRRLTYELTKFWDQNDSRLQSLFKSFRFGVYGLVVEVVALVVLIAVRMI